MLPKLFFVVFLSVTLVVLVLGAPRAIKNEEDLKKSVVEFLSQDETFLSALENSAVLVDRPMLVRHRRQSEANGMDIDSIDNGTVEEKEGFFDRAAKFVVDLLQRINSSTNTISTPYQRFVGSNFADDSTLHTAFSSRAPIPARQIRNERGRNVDNINMDLTTIPEWGSNNLVDFNANKTQACHFSRKADLTVPNISLSGVTIPLKTPISMLGITISNNLSWENHVRSIDKTASQKLGFLFRVKSYFTSSQLLMIYKAQIRPVLEYCFHIFTVGFCPKKDNSSRG
ncbi:unnamed protein product [Phaedon cochleariae]|uniref:Uncharacterized protein n=1 Tax=Phaedon cochleariae TaxID=80249 RepID=A0A9N9SLE7_PHACE|nr:unnamed protein product [Phaedon cochleariae]